MNVVNIPFYTNFICLIEHYSCVWIFSTFCALQGLLVMDNRTEIEARSLPSTTQPSASSREISDETDKGASSREISDETDKATVGSRSIKCDRRKLRLEPKKRVRFQLAVSSLKNIFYSVILLYDLICLIQTNEDDKECSQTANEEENSREEDGKRKRKLDYRGQTQPQTKRRRTIVSISLGNPLKGLTYVFHELIRNLRRTVSLFQGE